MKKEIIRTVLVIVIIIVFSIFIYPTPYHYTKYKDVPVKTNRFTGKVWILDPRSGWEERSSNIK